MFFANSLQSKRLSPSITLLQPLEAPPLSRFQALIPLIQPTSSTRGLPLKSSPHPFKASPLQPKSRLSPALTSLKATHSSSSGSKSSPFELPIQASAYKLPPSPLPSSACSKASPQVPSLQAPAARPLPLKAQPPSPQTFEALTPRGPQSRASPVQLLQALSLATAAGSLPSRLGSPSLQSSS